MWFGQQIIIFFFYKVFTPTTCTLKKIKYAHKNKEEIFLLKLFVCDDRVGSGGSLMNMPVKTLRLKLSKSLLAKCD